MNFTCEDKNYVSVKLDICSMTMLEMLLPRCNIRELSTQTSVTAGILISSAATWAKFQTALQTLRGCVCVCVSSVQAGWWCSLSFLKSLQPDRCFSGTKRLFCSWFLMSVQMWDEGCCITVTGRAISNMHDELNRHVVFYECEVKIRQKELKMDEVNTVANSAGL